MQNRDKKFPYPVLSPNSDDIVNSLFSVEAKGSAEELQITFHLDNEYIENLINTGIAAYAVHVECSRTRFRKVFTSKENSIQIPLSTKEVNEKVEIASMIVTLEEISEYMNPNFNEDFSGLSFHLRKNSIIAVGEDLDIRIENNLDPLKYFPSIFSIVNSKDPKSEDIKLELNDQKIKIVLNNKLFLLYKELQNNDSLHSNLGALFVIPALTEVLTSFNELRENYEDSNWFVAVEKKLKQLNIDPYKNLTENAFATAQKILGNTLLNSLNVLHELVTSEKEGE